MKSRSIVSLSLLGSALGSLNACAVAPQDGSVGEAPDGGPAAASSSSATVSDNGAPDAAGQDGKIDEIPLLTYVPGPVVTVGWNSAWDDTGFSDTLGAVPAATTWGANRLDVFENIGGGLFQRTSWGGAFGGNYFLNNKDVMASDPVGMGWGGQNIDLVWRDPQNSVDHFYWNGSAWTEENLTGTINGKPSIVVASDGSRGDVFARVGSSVWHRGWAFVPNTWEGWEPLPANVVVTDDPVAVSDTPGRIELFYRGAAGTIESYAWDGSSNGQRYRQNIGGLTWTKQPSLSGYLEGAPAVASAGGIITVAGVGGDDGIWTITSSNAGQSWSGWTERNGCSRNTQVALTSSSASRVDLFSASNDTGEVLHTFYGTSPSLTAGLTPVCCANDVRNLAVQGTSPTSANVTFTNNDNVQTTVRSTNADNPSLTTTSYATGAGAMTLPLSGLVTDQTYTIAARTGGANSVCRWNQVQVTPIPTSKTFHVSGQTSNFWTTFSFQAVITVTPDGHLSWTTSFTNTADFADYDYTLDIAFPGYGNMLETKGIVGESTTTFPPQAPLANASQIAWLKANYVGLNDGDLGWSLSILWNEDPGVNGGASTSTPCSGNTYTTYDIVCSCGGELVSDDPTTCTSAEALSIASSQHPDCYCYGQ